MRSTDDKSKNIMRFTVIGNTAGDCTTPYLVTEYEARTVREFINEVLESRPNEWGEISVVDGQCINNPSYEYKHGRLMGEFQKSILKREIDEVKASGGWSRMDYIIVVRRKRR